MNIATRILALAPLAVAFLVFPNAASAHGGAALTFTSTTTEGYVVDIDIADGYLQAGNLTRMDFGLFKDAARTTSAKFSDMWVRIVQKDGSKIGKTLFAGLVATQKFGGNGFGFVFPEGGTYTLSVRYNDTSKDEWGETLAEAEFPLDVLRGSDENKFKFDTEFWVGLTVGVFGVLVLLLPFLLKGRTKAFARYLD